MIPQMSPIYWCIFPFLMFFMFVMMVVMFLWMNEGGKVEEDSGYGWDGDLKW